MRADVSTGFRRMVFAGCALLLALWPSGRVVMADSSLPNGWDSRDIGDVGQPGGASYYSGRFAVDGAGADIWGTSDSFHFVSVRLPFAQGGAITARVVATQNTNPFAKAGVMIRTSYDPSSAHVILDVKPDGGVEFMSRPSSGAATTFIAGATATFPVWVRLTYDTTTVTGQVSNDGTTWVTIGSASLSAGAYAGFAVTSHDTNTLHPSVFDNVHVDVTGSTGLPDPWQQWDVGTTGVQGGASYSNGVLTVSGSGADIWGSADAFHFVYSQIVGDGQIVARVTSTQNTNPYAKAGVMIRESLDASASDVVLDLKPDGSVEFMARAASGADTTFIGTASQQLPGTCAPTGTAAI
jgi:hypothetical protein